MAPRKKTAAGPIAALLLTAVVQACGGARPAAQPAVDVGALQREIVEKLSGAAEIAPGLKLANRAAPEN